MNEIIQQMLLVTGSYILVIVIGYAIINFLTHGFITQYIRVKASRGKNVLVEVWSVTKTYFKVGKIIEGALVYSFNDGKQKQTKRLEKIQRDNIYRKMGISMVSVDEETNSAINIKTFEFKEGHDAVKTDSMIKRALLLPQINNQKDFIILVILLVLILAGVGTVIYLLVASGQVSTVGNV